MKKLILILAIVASTFSAFAQSVLYINKKDGGNVSFNISDIDSISFTPANSVLINGVRWATKNVNTPGTFAASSEASGMFYQWNSKTAWAATGSVTGWNSSWNGGFTTYSASNTWVTANDPSPTGYRVPTYAEICSLMDTTKVSSIWTTQNNIYGNKFTDKTNGNSIFLPASGFRDWYSGTLYDDAFIGHYWVSTVLNAGDAYTLSSFNSGAGWIGFRFPSGLSVRPVAK